MLTDGSIVTLRDAKIHGEGEDAMRLSAGTCGMVMQRNRRNTNGDHEYVIDFGPYGQWYCLESEMIEQSITPEPEEVQIPEIVWNAPQPGFVPLNQNNSMIFDSMVEDDLDVPVVDLEADIARRLKEIEKGL